MKFPDVSRVGSVTLPDAGHFVVVLVREDLTPGEAAGVLRGKIARAKYPLDAYDAGIQDVIDVVRAALAAANPEPAREDNLYPHRGGWRHAVWCSWERGGEDGSCTCGLDEARRSLLRTPTAPALDV